MTERTGSDKRLIEDELPIGAMSAEASREKSARKGHITTLHFCWARRPFEEGLRPSEVKGRTRGEAIHLTTNECYQAFQLGDSYWLYELWNPLGTLDPEPVRLQTPVKHLDHGERDVVAARYCDIPALAIAAAGKAR